jgi:hypothetical protein
MLSLILEVIYLVYRLISAAQAARCYSSRQRACFDRLNISNRMILRQGVFLVFKIFFLKIKNLPLKNTGKMLAYNDAIGYSEDIDKNIA